MVFLWFVVVILIVMIVLITITITLQPNGQYNDNDIKTQWQILTRKHI